MFDKNNPTPPPNLPGVEPKKNNLSSSAPIAPNHQGGEEKKNSSFSDKKEPQINKEAENQAVDDIFSAVESKKTKAVGAEHGREKASEIFSPNRPMSVGASTPESKIREAEDEINKIKREKSRKTPLIIALILILLLGIGGGAWYYFQFLASSPINSNYREQPVEVGEVNINQNQNSNQEINQNINSNQNADQGAKQNINIPARPVVVDSDSDGLSDEKEKEIGTNINLADTDNDGLLDKEEIDIYKTNPLNPDTDGDGYSDGTEIKSGYNPLGQGKLPVPPVSGIPQK